MALNAPVGEQCPLYTTLIMKDKIKKDDSKIEYAKYVICIDCKTPFAEHNITKDKCPQCGGEL